MILYYFNFILCVWCFAYMYACASCVYLLPTGARRGMISPWDWSYRDLLATKWVFGTEFACSGLAAGTRNHKAIPPVLLLSFITFPYSLSSFLPTVPVTLNLSFLSMLHGLLPLAWRGLEEKGTCIYVNINILAVSLVFLEVALLTLFYRSSYC